MFVPAGSRDEMGSVVHNRFNVMEKFRRIITLRGYNLISTPVVEYASTFTNEFVEMKLQDMMKWFNPEGEIEVLRPDWTTAIARALATQEKIPQKWAYQGSVFQQSTPGIESHQIGVETLHLPELLGEGECLLMARSFLRELGTGDCLVELGHTEIYESLASKLDLPKSELERLRLSMHDKKKDEVFQIAKNGGSIEIASELAMLVDAYGSLDVLTEYEERWKNQKNLLKILEHIKKVAQIQKQSGNEEVLIDLGMVKNLPYYSGMMFRGFLKETGEECFSGGRYDRLYEQFGESVSAVGLAFDVDVLAGRIVDSEKREKICIIADIDALAFTEGLRAEFQDAIVDVQFERLNDKAYDRVLEVCNRNGKFEVIER